MQYSNSTIVEQVFITVTYYSNRTTFNELILLLESISQYLVYIKDIAKAIIIIDEELSWFYGEGADEEWDYTCINEYTYDPISDTFYDGESEELATDKVEKSIRESLEKYARNSIDEILNNVPVLDLNQKIPINKTFEQDIGQVTFCNVTKLEGSFGSYGAAPCLIVLSVASMPVDNHQELIVKGYHLSDEFKSYKKSVSCIRELKHNYFVSRFYIVGGEVGFHTKDVTPNNSYCDYSQYYPFFKACEDEDVTFGGYRFPANATGVTKTSFAVTTNFAQKPIFYLWQEKSD